MFSKGTDISKHKICHTSGSTGIPLNIVRDKKTHDYSIALKAYAFMECGVKITDKFVTVGRSEESLWPNKLSMRANAEPDIIIKKLRQVNPDVIYTYANMLSSIASSDVSEINPRLIFTQGTRLSQHCRNLSRSAFGIKVFDTYGSTEFSRLAFECIAHNGLHMITDCAVMEFIHDGEPVSPEKPGEIVVTGLYNYTMPLIRYNLNDTGVPADETCSCGRSWPLIRRIEGRSVDFFTMPSGKKINPGVFYYTIFELTKDNILCISQFQIVQVKRDKIIINIVRGREFNSEIITQLKEKIEESFIKIGENVSVDVHVVNEMSKESTGKIRTMVSLAV
jgi:phenylacetate-CoA ligase